MATSELQIVLQRAEKLSPFDKAEVIKRLADSLTAQTNLQNTSKQLEYGKYKNCPGKPTDEEDFKIAESSSTDEEFEADMSAFAEDATDYTGADSREDVYFDHN